MPAKTKKTVLGTLCCVIIFVAWIEAKADRLLTQHEHCLGECRLAQGEGLQRESQINHDVFTSCNRKCLLRRKPHRIWNVKARKRRQINSIQRAPVCPVPEPSMEWHPTRTSIKAAIFQYGNSDDWFLNVTWPPMNDSIGTWKNIVFRLKVDTNDSGVDMDCYILPKSQTCFVANLTALNYKYDNDIAIEIHSLPYNSSVWELYMVYAPRNMTTPSATNAAHPTSDPSNTVKYVIIVAGTMGGIALVVSFLWFCLRRKKSNTPLPHDFEYHAFIIHSYKDKHWMKKNLLPLLEEKHHLTCCIHYKDFIPGKLLRDNMADSVYTSYKVIAIFSNNFVNSPPCMYELDVAVNRLVQHRDDSLAVIRIDGADCNHLPSELRSRCFIDYHFPHERPFWRRRLLRFFDLPEESRRQSTAEDPNNDDENRHDNRRV